MAEYVELSQEECADRLADRHFGRIALHGRDGLSVYPVNYTWSDGHVAIRTNPGAKLDGIAQSEVAFEIDEIDEAARTGWSVLVRGVGYEVTDSIDGISTEMRELPVDTWAPGGNEHWIRIEPRSITGRRVQPDRV